MKKRKEEIGRENKREGEWRGRRRGKKENGKTISENKILGGKIVKRAKDLERNFS